MKKAGSALYSYSRPMGGAGGFVRCAPQALLC